MAMRYPPEWLEELRLRADILQIVSEYVPLKQKGHSYWGLCPFHGEKTPSFKVDPDQGLYYCFGCKAGGSVFQFVMDMERMEFSEAVRFLAEKVRMPLPEQREDPQAEQRRSTRERILELNRTAARLFHDTLYSPEGERVLAYLHDRGLDDPAIVRFGLGAAPSGWEATTNRLKGAGATEEELVQAGLTIKKDGRTFDMFRGRAIFPIINAHGAVLGFGGRAMGDAQPKYLNTGDTLAFNKRQNVYAANLLRKARGLSRVLLVEGYMDVVSLVRQGIVGVCATLGTALTPEQAKLIKRYAPEIWIAYDGDSAGQNATLKALDILAAADIPARVLVIPEGKDPDEFIRAHGREAFEGLMPLTAPQYRMDRAEEGLDLSKEDDRIQYAMACAAILRQVRQPVELEALIKRLQLKSGFTREVLIQQIGMAKMEAPAPPARTPARRGTADKQPAFLTDRLKAERSLLSLVGAGMVEEGMVSAERFSDPIHRRIAEGLLGGRSPAEMLDAEEDDDARRIMLEVFSDPPQLKGDERLQVIGDYLERMRRGWIDEQLSALMESLRTAEGERKLAVMQEIAALNKEKTRLQPGRKE